MQLSPALTCALVSFNRLQTLTITSSSSGSGSSSIYTPCVYPQQQWCMALHQLRQLRKLGWELSLCEWPGPVDTLLESLPCSLQALDLRILEVTHGSTASSSSVAHLVHLTSLRLRGIDLMPLTFPDGHQQQQVAAPGLAALSMRPWDVFGWYAAPSVVALELVIRPNWPHRLDQLAACPHLRHLSLKYRAWVPSPSGVSALAQLTRLRVQPGVWIVRPGICSRTSRRSDELAALKQLQVLETSFCMISATEVRKWLPRLSCLTKLVVLAINSQCKDLVALQQLAEVVSEWRNSSSSSSSSSAISVGASTGPPGSSGSCGNAAIQAAPCTLRCVRLKLMPMTCSAPADTAWEQLQQAAADLATQLPWLQVTCEWDTYACPCWTLHSDVHQE